MRENAKKNTKNKRRKRRWPLYLFLALLCICVTELLVCRSMNPALYQQITAPIRQGVHQLATFGQSALTACQEKAGQILSAFDQKETLEEEQIVSEAVLPPPSDTADPVITSLIDQDGREVLTGGAYDVPYYNQTDPQWANQPYGTDHLGGYGCGPTTMAMAVSTLTGQTVSPTDMAAFCVEEGYWAKGGGSYLSLVPGVAQAYRLECESVNLDTLATDDLRQNLSSGKLIVALMTKGHFTQGGHFILLRGTALEGSILVADPASRERSLTLWDLSLLLEELSPSRSHGAPLWILSRNTNLVPIE